MGGGGETSSNPKAEREGKEALSKGNAAGSNSIQTRGGREGKKRGGWGGFWTGRGPKRKGEPLLTVMGWNPKVG